MRFRVMAWASLAMVSVSASMVTAVPATAGGTSLDPAKLKSTLDGVHDAGMPGVFAEVRDTGQVWRGASGVADLDTGRPVEPGMRQRIGSITKTFTAAAILQQVEQGRIRLDAAIGHYLPELVPGERGERITVRMLLDHTSGIADYLPAAFPSLQKSSPQSLDDNRFKQFRPAELIKMGLGLPAGEPGSTPGVYSNTNYLLLGQLLERVTGTTAEKYITRNVIERAGLRDTAFPAGPRIEEPHSRLYEAFFGLLDPPRDYSVYNMSWVRTTADLVSTVEDLNRFFKVLLEGKIVDRSSLTQMQRTVPVVALDGSTIDYGLGLRKLDVPGCGTFWGNDGSVWGGLTMSWIRADGKRQVSVAMNLARWAGSASIDGAIAGFRDVALRG